MGELVTRGPIKAGILSFVAPGLGQLYNGQWEKAVVLYVFGVLASAVFLNSHLPSSFVGLVTSLAILLAVSLLIVVDAVIGARSIRSIALRPYNRWYYYGSIILMHLIVVGPFVAPSGFPIKAYKMTSGSMVPTMRVGDRIIVDKQHYEKAVPARGDAVVFKFPPDPRRKFLKRVVGLSGEKIEIRDHVVFANDQPLKEPYVLIERKGKEANEEHFLANFGPLVVPEGKLFVMGDNREMSRDSRSFGPIGVEDLKGKALYIYWAKDRSRIGRKIE